MATSTTTTMCFWIPAGGALRGPMATTNMRAMWIMMAIFTSSTAIAMLIQIPAGGNKNRYTNSSIPIYFSILL